MLDIGANPRRCNKDLVLYVALNPVPTPIKGGYLQLPFRFIYYYIVRYFGRVHEYCMNCVIIERVHFTLSGFIKSACMKTSTGSWHNSLQTSISRADFNKFAPNSKKKLDTPSYCLDEGDDGTTDSTKTSMNLLLFFSSPRQHKLLWFNAIISSCCCVQLKSPLWLDSSVR